MKTTAIFLFSLLSIFAVSAQTADEIVAKHIEAIGGKDALSKTVSIYVETSTSVMGNDAPGKIYILNGKGYKSEMEMMGNTMIQCVSPNGGWTTNPMSGDVSDMPADQYSMMAANISLGGALMDYSAKGTTVELDGSKKLDAVDAYKLKITLKGGKTSFYYIDKATNYLVRTEAKGDMMGQEVDVVTTFSDFKKLENGYVMPYKTDIDLGQFALSTTFNKVELNKAIDEKIFQKAK